MQPHVSPQQLHFRPARPPRSEPAQLPSGRRSNLLPASISNTDEPALAGLRRAPFAGVLRTRSHSRIPCSIFLLLHAAREASIPAFFSPVNILIPSRSHSRYTYIALGLPLHFSNSSTLRSQGYPQVLFEPHLNSHDARSRNAASRRHRPRILGIPHRGNAALARVCETTRRCRPIATPAEYLLNHQSRRPQVPPAKVVWRSMPNLKSAMCFPCFFP